MELQDARTIPAKQLEERLKQAVLLRQQGMTYAEIGSIVGVNRNKVSDWIKMWNEGGFKALKVGKSGRPKGSGASLMLSSTKEASAELEEYYARSTHASLCFMDKTSGGHVDQRFIQIRNAYSNSWRLSQKVGLHTSEVYS